MQESRTTGFPSAVRTVARAADILEALAVRAERGARLGEVAATSGLGRATAHRLLRGLIEAGLAEQSGPEPLYFPGLRLLGVLASAADRHGLVAHSEAARRRVADLTGDTVFLTVRAGQESVCTARTEGPFPIRALTLEVGSRRPLGVGAGSLAILATLDDAEQRDVLADAAEAHAPFGLEPGVVAREVEAARARGWALDEGAVLYGITGIGVAIRDGRGVAVAALSVAAISARLEGARREAAVAALSEEAVRIEAALAPLLTPGAAAAWGAILGTDP